MSRIISQDDIRQFKKTGAKVIDDTGKTQLFKRVKPKEQSLNETIKDFATAVRSASEKNEKSVSIAVEVMKNIITTPVKPPKVEVNIPESKPKKWNFEITRDSDNLIKSIKAVEV